MVTHDARIRDKGQVTIPADLREEFDLRTGDTLRFESHPEGILLRRPRDIARSTAGVLNRYTVGKPVLTPEEINRVASEAIGESGIRTLREIDEEYDNG